MAKSRLDMDRLSPDELKLFLLQALEGICELKLENAALREEIARLKGLKGKPDIKANIKPSGMARNAMPRLGKKPGGNKPAGRGSKNDKLVIDETKVLKPDSVPEGSALKGHETYVVQDLIVRPWTVCYWRQRWKTPAGETIVAPLPDSVIGHFGANLVRFVLAQYHKCQVTVPRLSEQLHDFGLLISERHVMRLLIKNKADFLAEASGVVRAGLETAKWITVDDTGARHQARNGYCTHIGNEHFAWFATTSSKSRLNFLELLRAGDKGYQINDAALDYMRAHCLPKDLVRRLGEHQTGVFAGREAWMSHLQALRFTELKVHPDPVRVASEGALWGRITALGVLNGTVIVSDGAGQFRVGDHALCWVHGERLVYKLNTFSESQRRAIERTRRRIWWLYADIKDYCHDPTALRKDQLGRRFEDIFTAKTGFAALDRQLKRLHARRSEMLKVLERPDIPLHTNGSENDIRCQVTRRKISGGTRSNEGRECRDGFLSLMKTCSKLGISFWDYLGTRLSVPDAADIPPLPDLIRKHATS
jgi:hypothetical protein